MMKKMTMMKRRSFKSVASSRRERLPLQILKSVLVVEDMAPLMMMSKRPMKKKKRRKTVLNNF